MRQAAGDRTTAQRRRTALLSALVAATLALSAPAAGQPPPDPPAATPAERAAPAGPVDPAATQPIVLGDVLTFHSRVLGEERPVMLRVPASYARSPARRYPVLVLLDAEAHFHHASGLAAYLGAQGLIPEMIVVGLPNTNRGRDFSPVPTADRPGSGGGGRFASFLADELVPWLDATYRTAPFRLLFGHSATGNYALWLLGEKPDLFAGVVAASPWVIWNEGWIVAETEVGWRRRAPGGRFAYFTAGDEPELLPTLDRYRAVLRRRAPKSLAWRYQPLPREDHGSLVPATVEDGLRWIFDGWRFDQPDADLAALRRHYRQLSERLGWQVPPPEAAVNIHGYRQLAAGRTERALELFRANVAAHPESANVHDSLGEGLEAAGRLDEAVASYRRAVALGRANDDPFIDAFLAHLEAAERKLSGGDPVGGS